MKLGTKQRKAAGRGSWWARARVWLASGAVAIALACVGEYPQTTLSPTTDFGDIIHQLYTSVFWWTMIIMALVFIALTYVLIRFRERPGQPEPKQIHGHLGLEIAWTIAPAIIVVAIAIPTVQAVFATQRPISDDALVVEVVGHRFWWEFRYPESGVVTANELHLPANRPVSLRLSSADVIHSFWVPQLGGKRDANPVRRVPEGQDPHYTWLYFTPRETGEFMGQCAEFCGSSHALMGIRVVVETPEEFDRWVGDWQTPSPTTAAPVAPADTAATPAPAPQEDARIALGRTTFHQGFCVACHAIQGTNAQGVLGPNLTRIGGRSRIAAGLLENTPENLAAWIRAPQTVKPGALMPGAQTEGGGFPATNWTEEQIQAVAAYLASLR